MQGWDTPRHDDGEFYQIFRWKLKGPCEVKTCTMKIWYKPKVTEVFLDRSGTPKTPWLLTGSEMVRERGQTGESWEPRDSFLNDRIEKGLTKKNIGDRPIKVIGLLVLPGTAACHPHHLCQSIQLGGHERWSHVANHVWCLGLGAPGPCALCFLPADPAAEANGASGDEDEWFHFVGSFAISFCLPCHHRSQVDSLWKRKSRLYTKVKQG